LYRVIFCASASRTKNESSEAERGIIEVNPDE
jgi:hypothetical protein